MMQVDTKKKMFLESEALLRYFMNKDESIDTLIMCKSAEIDLITSAQAIYSALGSLEDKDKFKLNKLIKLFEVAKIVDNGRKVLTHEYVEGLRKNAFKKKENAGGKKNV